MTGSERSGRIDYDPEGFILFWDNVGLSIQVTDYHAGILQLSWNTVLDLAKRAGQTADAAPGPNDV